ncbi:hypothetical protein [Ornithinimicrobium sediminis]|uniref:hypothetical protein n=1 Tax=Ornithinimicrobium sediminis TaxID=2904603 RepID=UPI001E5CD609|nr:hypothetical protein [Ornithinimicrobium sediminis]MCE0485268.1 hypothetical protein [Ornithinimicrobium sediminis]
MTTTRLLATALPHSLAPDAPFHLSVFFTHRLTPDAAPSVLGDFPDTASWVTTLLAGTLDLVTDTAPGGIPVRVVSEPAPDQDDWSAVFPEDTPVVGFPTPHVTDEPWRTFPAHAMDGHALDLHLGSTLVSPLAPPPVLGNPLVEAVLQPFGELQTAVRELLGQAGARAERDAEVYRRRLAEVAATLGQRGLRDGGYPSEPTAWTSAVEVLLRDTDGDRRFTDYLDSLLEETSLDDPVLVALRDVHAARRFYQREEPAYLDRPDPEAVHPRPEVPEQDFHERAGSLGSTPVLLRALGLVVDVAVDDPDDRQLLAGASWVSARFSPAEGADVVRLAPPRTWCESSRGHFRAVSSDAWAGGAMPLGDPDTYTVLDLDPDASALKLEQHVRDLPRALATELNGDPVTAAPASLRATGFSIARTGRDAALLAQVQRAETLTAADDDGTAAGPDLSYDDLVRGIRLEVWDDESTTWHSVHARRVDVTAGGRPVLEDTPDTGFLQLTGLTKVPGEGNPYYLHEVFVGWDGWSLSAPRPGKVVVHGDGVNGPAGEELVLDEPPDPPAGHVHTTTRVEPGTLPWLRYGRRYSFRVRGVDLAGNSVPRPAAGGAGGQALAAAEDQLELLRRTFAERDRSGLLGVVREDVLERLPGGPGPEDTGLLDLLARTAEDLSGAQGRMAREARPPQEVRLPQEAVTGVEEVDSVLLRRATERVSTELSGEDAALRRGVTVALGRLARTHDTWRVRAHLEVDPSVFAGLDDTRDPIVRRPGSPRVPGVGVPPVAPRPLAVPVVTTPRPFLRWHPVPPPTLVARHPLGPGESLQRLVVRDDQSTQRHVAPPKGTQLEAEQHGEFDAAIGSSDPAVHDQLLATALKERGTLLDEWVQDLADPTATVHQDGIALHTRPGADPDAQVTLEQVTTRRDTPLGEGQYVVHDTDRLVLPYLPDPLAHGASLVFYDAGAGHTLPEPRVLQTVVLPYAGGWPGREPLRLVLEPGEQLGARREGNLVRVSLPAGEEVRVAMSSALDEERLQVLGLWRSHVASAPGGDEADGLARALLARAAANGWFWWLTPSHDLRLVHAVRQPVRPPELAALRVLLRPPGLTVAALAGVVDVHGPSTERLVLEASWSEWVDDLAAEGPQRVERQDVVLSSPVHPDDHYGLLHLVDAVVGGDGGTVPVVSHRALQTFTDTHHRRVTYTPRGVTRYAEFFDPSELPAPDDPSLRGAPRELTVVSSARPAAPVVTDVGPLLLWEEQTEADQPFALRRTRRSGARVWLDRPWFSSGDGELLGVVLAASDAVPPSLSSRWGKDPTQLTGIPPTTTMPPLVGLGDLVLTMVAGEVVDPRPGRPVTPFVSSALVDAKDTPTVSVLGYRPEFHPGRRQWFVDVAMDPGDSVWPFVRLALARYQPHSLPGHDLSPVVMADWVQPLPERTATASRRTDETVRLTVTGPVGLSRLPDPRWGMTSVTSEAALDGADALLRASREVFATVQEAPAAGGSDLEWVDHERVRLPLVGFAGLRVTWSAELTLPEPVAVATPGSSTRLRVLLEEHEHFDADPDEGPNRPGKGQAHRLVYADHVPL